MKRINFLNLFSVLFAALFMVSCQPDDADYMVTPPEQAHFALRTTGSYQITAPGVTYKVPVAITTPSSSDRTVTVNITSPTGAVEGTHYTVDTKTVTIPAGQVVDSITVTGNFAQYTSGRRDSLFFTIIEPGVTAAANFDTFKLFMRGPCFETADDVNLNDLLGNYNNTVEDWGGSLYGPYQTQIVAVNQLTATTGTITVKNIFDAGWNNLVFTLDWTDLANKKATLVTQNAGGNAGGSFGATYNGQPYGVRPVSAAAGGAIGTFEYCSQKITLKMQVGIFGVGYAADIYTLTMQR